MTHAATEPTRRRCILSEGRVLDVRRVVPDDFPGVRALYDELSDLATLRELGGRSAADAETTVLESAAPAIPPADGSR